MFIIIIIVYFKGLVVWVSLQITVHLLCIHLLHEQKTPYLNAVGDAAVAALQTILG